MDKIIINKKSNQPLFIQIRDQIRKSVESGLMKPGERLPAISQLAKILQVNPLTVRRAITDLIDSGYLHSHVGRGTFVATTPLKGLREKEDYESVSTPVLQVKSIRPTKEVPEHLFYSFQQWFNDMLQVAEKRKVIRFTSGTPDLKLIGERFLEKILKEILKGDESKYINCCDPRGVDSLREVIAEKYHQRGVNILPEEIMITNGAQQGIALLAQMARKNEIRVICETPSYTGIFKAFLNAGNTVETIIRDQKGPLPDQIELFADGYPFIVYTCPEVQNPMGTDITPGRMRKITSWVKKQKGWLISDEVFSDLYFDSHNRPRVINDLGKENCFTVGSLSKSIFPGSRIGWIISSKSNIEKLTPLKHSSDICSPPLLQEIARILLQSDDYDRIMVKIRKHYLNIKNLILDALTLNMPEDVNWTNPQGGCNLWIELPPGFSSLSLFQIALEKGVTFIPGSFMDIQQRFNHALRLGYGSIPTAHVQKGIKVLSQAIKDLYNLKKKKIYLFTPEFVFQ
jgi:DNA-binding transcriptional MocR family regulator